MLPHVLFCNDMFDPKMPDPDFVEEFNAAKNAGLATLLLSFEDLTKEKDAALATKRIRSGTDSETVIYRGWMLKPYDYTLLYDALLLKNYRLINTPAEYKNCHYLPDSYPFIEKHTPKTTWVKIENDQVDYAKIFNAIKPFGNAPLVIKDYVKSQKHYWDTACFIPSAADKEKVKSIISTFIQLQGEGLNEGIVIREFVPLNDIAIHSKSGMPLKQEYRLFFLNKKLIGVYDYWEEGNYTDEPIPLDLFKGMANNIESNFFSMDIAKTTNGEWIIIELGDGQVAGLPDKADKDAFYAALFNCT
jgi:hypothetical protein